MESKTESEKKQRISNLIKSLNIKNSRNTRIVGYSDEESLLGISDRRLASEREKVRIDGLTSFYKLRNYWSIALSIFIAYMLIFQSVIAMAIGFGWLNLEKYHTFLLVVIGENFLQIIGMGYIVVKFLFDKNGKN